MKWILATFSVLVWGTFFITVHRFQRHTRERQARWEAAPTLYTLDELRAWYAEHRELEDAGLLEPDQPTPWSHALHQTHLRGTFKDRVQLRMVFENPGGQA